MVLLSGAALFVKSYCKLTHVDTGLASSGVYLSDVTWPASADGNSVDGAFVRRVGSQIVAQVGQLPGVQAAALIKGLPFQIAPDGGFEIEGRPLPADPHLAPDYFKVFGIPILRGRAFTPADSQFTTGRNRRSIVLETVLPRGRCPRQTHSFFRLRS